MNSNSGWTSTTFGRHEVLHQTYTHVPVFWFHIYALCFSWSFKKEESIPTSTYSQFYPSHPSCWFTHQAAPTTDREMARPMPRQAHMNGDVSVRNLWAKTETEWLITTLQLTVRHCKHSCRAPLKHSNGIYSNMEKRWKPLPDYWASVDHNVPRGWCKTAYCIYRIFT